MTQDAAMPPSSTGPNASNESPTAVEDNMYSRAETFLAFSIVPHCTGCSNGSSWALCQL